MVAYIGNLDSSTLHHSGTKSRILKGNMLIGNGLNHLFGHAVSGTQVELLAGFVERIDCASLSAGKLDSLGDNRGQHRVEVERGIDRLADLPECSQFFD